MIRRPPRSTLSSSSAASDVYKRQVEDVGIAVGQALCDALGTRTGCVRMATAQHQVGASSIEAVLDLSNRPGCFSDLSVGVEFVGDTSAEMVSHFFESLASAARVTLHLVSSPDAHAGTPLDAVCAAAGAVGRAFKHCSIRDSRLCGQVASSKGTLSV
eukprot:TRINITY_DN11181_c0_g1_i1.p2 TRINITY_DN11181_c0_g1~~TRINITY_DN11181_c0_g1_i1.p2  ORF type:complete len:158 (+),score=29.46 TRINITY_DN11181_c0_g1_i1:126-599(+)